MKKRNRLMHSVSYQGMIERKDSEYLEHFGMKGMKWRKGARGVQIRLQNGVNRLKSNSKIAYDKTKKQLPRTKKELLTDRNKKIAAGVATAVVAAKVANRIRARRRMSKIINQFMGPDHLYGQYFG